MNKFVPSTLVIFSRKSGVIKKIMQSIGNAQMRLYLYQKGLKKTEDAIIFEVETGLVKYYFEGNGIRKMPKQEEITKDIQIGCFCDGLFEESKEMWKQR